MPFFSSTFKVMQAPTAAHTQAPTPSPVQGTSAKFSWGGHTHSMMHMCTHRERRRYNGGHKSRYALIPMLKKQILQKKKIFFCNAPHSNTPHTFLITHVHFCYTHTHTHTHTHFATIQHNSQTSFSMTHSTLKNDFFPPLSFQMLLYGGRKPWSNAGQEGKKREGRKEGGNSPGKGKPK